MFFANISYLLLFIPLIAYIVWYLVRGKKLEPSMKVSTTLPFAKGIKSFRNRILHVPFILRMIVFSMVIIILARPQSSDSWEESDIEGIDIMLATDVSTSMLAMDLQPNRIEAAKEVAANFVNGRKNDNIGLTIFAGESFTQCPLTIDHAVLLNMLNAVKCDIALNGVIQDGTAIGMGIANGVSRLKDSQAKSKVIILLTDGSNNSGEISPEAAAEIAKEFGIRIYTIGVGTNNKTAPFPYNGTVVNVPVEIDETTLKNIADITNGKYYRATSKESLGEIYNEIDKLERTKLHAKQFSAYNEEYHIFALIALLALLLEIILRNTVLRKIP
ncbi:MAG: VWA domain-containing protein [Bacteroidaceae bacterium]|nr:VWA domain-containing protein [Bacteroidaceae bacterium]